MKMDGRSRLKQALEHREGEVPVDFGATIVTGMHVSIVEALRRRLGLTDRPVKVHEPYQMLGLIEEDLQDALGIDVQGVFRKRNFFGVANEHWRSWKTPWGQEVLIAGDMVLRNSRRGEVLAYPQGDGDAPPSGRMPEGGYFFDSITRQGPIDESKLDSRDNQVEFGPISDEELDYLRIQTEEHGGNHRSLVGGFGGASFGDAASITAPFLKHPRGIRDLNEWYISLISRPGYIRDVFSVQCDYALQNLARIYDTVGDSIDVVVLSGTDFGTQNALFISTETFDHLFAPFYQKVNDWIHSHTPWKTFIHTDGAVEPIIPRLIDAGFDILNPFQYTADGMDPKQLKEKFGRSLVFWGGGIETQRILPFGTPGEVKSEVLRQCEILAPGGGFVFSSVHNILAKTPVENVIAVFEGIREYNGR